ncbi:hypothetical protein [Clostridium gasigenes]|nr:hypothetical protein [Clostridium gasigenes]
MKDTMENERSEERIDIAINLLDVLNDETIAKKTGLDIKFVKALREEYIEEEYIKE